MNKEDTVTHVGHGIEVATDFYSKVAHIHLTFRIAT